jgi:hypothetical protein
MNAPNIPPPGADYTARIHDAVMDAIMRESVVIDSDGKRVAALISRDIIAALMAVESVLLATSPDLASPTALRKFCEDHGRRLYRSVRTAQAHPRLRAAFDSIDTATTGH